MEQQNHSSQNGPEKWGIASTAHRHGPDVVCNCHDCTQARAVYRAGGLKAVIDALRVMNERIDLFSGIADGLFQLRQDQREDRTALARIEQSQATLAGEIDKWSHDAEPPKAYWETHFGRICFVSDEDRDRASSFLSDHELGAYKRGKAERAVAKQKAPRSSSQARRGKVRGDRGRKR
jgi:hypothetical protein